MALPGVGEQGQTARHHSRNRLHMPVPFPTQTARRVLEPASDPAIDAARRRLIHLSLLTALPGAFPLGKTSNAFAADATRAPATNGGSKHDFDFFLGTWQVHHRRLKKRLANNTEWEEFEGTTHCQSLLGGIANLNDSVVNRPGSTYRGMGIRAYDAKTDTWADWYLDGRNPTRIDAPGLGRFANGIGTFLSDETFEGKPVKVRGVFTSLTPASMQWEQAFSPDEGKTWETNYVMRYTRVAKG
jgi:hypothetical protein